MITHVQRLSICAERPVKIIEELHCESAEKLNLRFILTNALRLGARLYMQRLICFFRSVCKLTSQWICSQNQPICQPALLSTAICRLKSQCFCMCIVGILLRITLMSGLLLLVTGRALLMSPKRPNASSDGPVGLAGDSHHLPRRLGACGHTVGDS